MSKKVLILIGGGILLAVVSIIFVFLKSSSALNTNQQTFSSSVINSSENERVLANLETQIYVYAKNGISPDAYREIDLALTELEEQGFEPARTRALRAAMSKLSMSGENPPSLSVSPDPILTPELFLTPQPPPIIPTPTTIPTPVITATPIPTTTPMPSASTPQASCTSNPNPVFIRHVTDLSQVNYVVPPPTIAAGPSLKTHGYLGTDHARVPVYAPVDMVLNTGAYFEGGPYWLGFEVSCEVIVRIGHITEPIQAIKDVFPSTPASSNDSRDQQIKNKISFMAGDLIGYTTGTSAAGNWDMGVYNSTTSNKYKGDPTWGNSWVYTTAVCPFDYFEPGLKSAYTSKFDSQAMAGNSRDGESFCK